MKLLVVDGICAHVGGAALIGVDGGIGQFGFVRGEVVPLFLDGRRMSMEPVKEKFTRRMAPGEWFGSKI